MRSFLAGIAMLVAGLLGAVALTSYLVHQTVLNPDQPGHVLKAALSQPHLRHQILDDAVPGYSGLPAGPRHEVNQVLASKRLQNAVEQVHIDAHGRVDLGPLRTRAERTLRANGQPQLAQLLAQAGGPTSFQLPSTITHRYHQGRRLTWDVATRAGLAAAALYLFAFAVAPNRRRALLHIGLVVLVSCGGALALFWLLPNLAQSSSQNIWVDAVAAGTRAYGSDAVKGLLPVAAVGVVLALLSFLLPGRRRA